MSFSALAMPAAMATSFSQASVALIDELASESTALALPAAVATCPSHASVEALADELAGGGLDSAGGLNDKSRVR